MTFKLPVATGNSEGGFRMMDHTQQVFVTSGLLLLKSRLLWMPLLMVK